MEKKKSLTLTDKISYVLLAAGVIIFLTGESLIRNPDHDSFFLIDLGRYIVNNRALPTTAYWLITDDVPTIVQQWMCDASNYIAYSLGGYTGLVILGILFDVILLGCMFIYCKELFKNCRTAVVSAVFLWLLLGEFTSTRPFSITISIALLELTFLHRYFSKDEHTREETLKFFLLIAAVFIFQVNWQASNILFPVFWLLCYIPVVKEDKMSIRFGINLQAVSAIAIGLVSSMLSPNGIHGTLYLFYSRGSLEGFNIYECQPPKLWSVYPVMIAMIVALLVYAAVKHKLTAAQFLLAAGCVFMSVLFQRCCWTLVLPLAQLMVNFKLIEKKERWIRWGLVAACILSVNLIFKYKNEKTDDLQKMLDSVPAPDQVTLYTDFNSGAYFLIDGYKIYFDARPELYHTHIAGEKAFTKEALAVWTGDIDYAEFIEKYGFDWFAVSSGSHMDDYLYGEPDYEQVFENEDDGIVIYRRIQEQTNP